MQGGLNTWQWGRSHPPLRKYGQEMPANRPSEGNMVKRLVDSVGPSYRPTHWLGMDSRIIVSTLMPINDEKRSPGLSFV